MVWVDDHQRLHLRIAKHGNDWHCSELICKASQGYNRYNFDVGSRVDLLDPNVIAGVFTWDDCASYANPPNNYYREIDFEFSRWGNPDNINSQFVVQPYDVPGNIDRFDMNLSGLDHSVHSLDWSPDSLILKSTWGNSSHLWKYTNTNFIPAPGNENVRINLHLFYGAPPSDHLNAELILNSFMTAIGDQKLPAENVKIFPNPCEQNCLMEIQSDRYKDVEIGILDLQGKLLKLVFHGKISKGPNRTEWDGNTGNGKPVQPGLYFIYVKDETETRYFKIIKI